MNEIRLRGMEMEVLFEATAKQKKEQTPLTSLKSLIRRSQSSISRRETQS